MTVQVDMPHELSNEKQDILSLLGDCAFTRLCMVFGGARLYIADSERSRQRLTVIVGEELTEKIIFHYKGSSLDLPKLSIIEIDKRRKAVIEDHNNGMSNMNLAMKYDMTERNIRKIISNHKDDQETGK
ncbi:MAG: hypothetical protein H6936_09445 [Burkholderiales bacterium]|nr:hypothetical protein [Nitrosomonas sp.]MCP5275057.1 hypothetical protein [Burkholderiales bacterium]